MTDPTTGPPTGGQPPRGTQPRKVLQENVQIDVSDLDREQVEELRRRLREFGRGISDQGDFGVDLMRSHSSHGDDDGWI